MSRIYTSNNNIHRRKRNNKNRRAPTNNRKKRNRRGNTTMGPYDVPNVKNNPIFARVIRYRSPGIQTSFTFSTTDLFWMMGFAVTTAQAYSLMSAVRLRRLRIILTPDASEVSGSAILTWLGQFAPNNESNMVYMPGVVSSENFYPPVDSVPGWWITDTTDTQDIFSIELSSAIIFMLDIEIEFTLPQDNTQTTSLVISGGTADRIVYPSLPRSTASSRLIPVGLPTVA